MIPNIGSKIFKQDVKFIASIADINQFPRLSLPQVAFVGRSNVGKSSLINSICNRKVLARVSNTPGRTQQINFFSLANKLILADLPGYGFARVSKQQKLQWDRLISYYLETNKDLYLVNVLIDARRGIKDNDIEIINMLSCCSRAFQVILTKSDKERVSELYIRDIQNKLSALGFYHSHIIATSSKNNTGIKELQYSIYKIFTANNGNKS